MQPNKTLALVVRLHDGASCPPCPPAPSPSAPDIRALAGERANSCWCLNALTVATATARVKSSLVMFSGRAVGCKPVSLMTLSTLSISGARFWLGGTCPGAYDTRRVEAGGGALALAEDEEPMWPWAGTLNTEAVGVWLRDSAPSTVMLTALDLCDRP